MDKSSTAFAIPAKGSPNGNGNHQQRTPSTVYSENPEWNAAWLVVGALASSGVICVNFDSSGFENANYAVRIIAACLRGKMINEIAFDFSIDQELYLTPHD